MNYAASIIIPLLRQVDDWLEQSVRSALAQTVPTEIVVVRSSTTPPPNLQILDRLRAHHSNLVVLLEDVPGSFPGAINMGIRHASADRIGLLLSDDWLSETTIADCLRETADIVSTGKTVYFADGRVNETATKMCSMPNFLVCKTLQAKANYLSHFFLFQRELLLRVGGLDTSIGNYAGVDDYDLIWTLLEHGATVAIIEKRLYHYRDHEGERLTLQDPEKSVLCVKRIFRKHGVPEAEAREIIKRHARWYGRPLYKVYQDRMTGSET